MLLNADLCILPIFILDSVFADRLFSYYFSLYNFDTNFFRYMSLHVLFFKADEAL